MSKCNRCWFQECSESDWTCTDKSCTCGCDDEEFCDDCFAGLLSREHHEKCGDG